jgi:hypothetical protein
MRRSGAPVRQTVRRAKNVRVIQKGGPGIFLASRWRDPNFARSTEVVATMDDTMAV